VAAQGRSVIFFCLEDRNISKLEGNIQSLKPSQLKALTRLTTRRFPLQEVYTLEQARELAALSRSISRQIGLLIDRRGRVEMVIVGEAGAILIPALPRGRSGNERLRGLRLLHTHLTPEGLSEEDLMDLLFLRLDAVISLTVSPWGEPVQWQQAYLLPPNPENKAYRLEPPQPWEQAAVDMRGNAEALENELAREQEDAHEQDGLPRAVLVSVATTARPEQERNLAELKELARTAGLNVVAELVQRVKQVNPKFILGKGKMAELEVLALQGRASVLVFDGELAPAQLHNLADITERKVIDRTQLILDIFVQHATTKAGQWQVAMAQMHYTLPRLVGKNRAMDRLMGGIGGRGPGETKLETDRRRIRERIARMKKELEGLRRQRAFTRARRSRQGMPVAALVGYTNAGKSTLLNTLTKSSVLAENKLFATLDPTTRRLRFPKEREVILADTVGFIRNLPKELTDAFRATLEELEAADVLIHVADASHPELEQQLTAVESILFDMELHTVPRMLVLNKIDRLSPAARADLLAAYPHALPIAALTGEGIAQLMQTLEEKMACCGAPLQTRYEELYTKELVEHYAESETAYLQ
jgi:GTPase